MRFQKKPIIPTDLQEGLEAKLKEETLWKEFENLRIIFLRGKFSFNIKYIIEPNNLEKLIIIKY